MRESMVLCGANAYEKKYYFNPLFQGMPESIQEELHIISVLFTEDVGGIFTIEFDEEGILQLKTDADEGDLLYDEVSSGLLIKEILKNKQDLFESLHLYYKVFILKENPGNVLTDCDCE